MSSVDEVFRQMQTEQNEVSMLSGEETIDSNDYCMLESDTTRKVLIPEKYSIFGVESDEYAKTVKFAFPRYVNDGKLDLSEYSIRINYMTANPDTENNKDQIQAKNVHVVDDYVVFEWELSRRVTQYRGTITFIVCAVTAESNGEITTEWNTTIATSQSIEGLEVSPNENEEEQARDLLTELLVSLNNSKNDAIAEITQTKTQAISDVEAEGQTQISAVDAKGAQVLESIPDDYTTLENRVDELEQNRAYVIVGEGSGEFITLNDSSELKTRNIKLFGKSVQSETTGAQLFDVMAGKNEDASQYKITINDYATGKITVSMDNPEGAVVMPVNRLSDYCSTMTAGNTYYLSGKHDGSSNGDISLVDVSDTWDFGTSREITEQDLQSAVKFGFGTYSNIMIVEGSAEKPYEVYTGGEAATEPTPEFPLPITSAGNYDAEGEKYEIGINVIGENFWSNLPENKTHFGVNFSTEEDGTIILNGRCTGSFNLMTECYLPKGNYSLYAGVEGSLPDTYTLIDVFDNKLGKQILKIQNNEPDAIDKKQIKNTGIYEHRIRIEIGFNYDNVKIKPMLIIGQEKIPYVVPKRKINVVSIPNPLRGIPVDSGGNYTDAEGQQWLCDYIDRERGKYVQCVGKYECTGNENLVYQQEYNTFALDFGGTGVENRVCICDRFFSKQGINPQIADYLCCGFHPLSQYSNYFYFKAIGEIHFTLVSDFKKWLSNNPTTIIYQFKTPTETDLTPDQIAALNLSTYQGITNIGTDTMPQVGVEVEYIADTKTYIDNAIAEAIAAIPTE